MPIRAAPDAAATASCFFCSSRSGDSCKILSSPSIPVIGVLISWLIVDRKSDFARLALSALLRASACWTTSRCNFVFISLSWLVLSLTSICNSSLWRRSSSLVRSRSSSSERRIRDTSRKARTAFDSARSSCVPSSLTSTDKSPSVSRCIDLDRLRIRRTTFRSTYSQTIRPEMTKETRDEAISPYHPASTDADDRSVVVRANCSDCFSIACAI